MVKEIERKTREKKLRVVVAKEIGKEKRNEK